MPPLTQVFLLAICVFAASLAAASCAADPTPAPPATTAPPPTRSAEAGTPVSMIPAITPAAGRPPASTGEYPPEAATAAASTRGAPPPATGNPQPTLAAETDAIASSAADSTGKRSGPPPIYLTPEDRPGEPELVRHGGEPQSHPIQAGEIDDNDGWEAYLEYARDYEGPPVRRTRISERYVIQVNDSLGRPVHGAHLTLQYENTGRTVKLRTHADGRALHHPADGDTGPLDVVARHGSTAHHQPVNRSADGAEIMISLPAEATPPHPLQMDALFLLDATGSMADEIARIKETLVSIGQQISDLPQMPELRIAMVAYRDREDEFVTRVFDFQKDVASFLETVRAIEAEGGGDYAESLNQGLHEALTETSWREDAVKLVFLLADAPPHVDYAQDEDYVREMARAQATGTKIFAVASSGLDAQGEYIFRQLAQQTMGRFVFILYESGPQGELTTPHDVGDDFSVEKLDRLIVRLITEELESMTP